MPTDEAERIKRRYGSSVAILGARTDKSSMSNKALRAFREEGFMVYPIHPEESTIEGARCYEKLGDIPNQLSIVSVYIGPEISMKIGLPKQITNKGDIKLVIFNPETHRGTLEREIQKAEKAPEIIKDCSITLIGLDPNDFWD